MRYSHRFILFGVLTALLLFVLPVVAVAQSTGQVTRSVDITDVCSSDIVTVTITPTAVLSFYAIQENLGILTKSAAGLVAALALIVLPVTTFAQSTGQVTREVDIPENLCRSDIVTVTITPTGVLGFYAIQEKLGTLTLIDHTADLYDDGVFLLLAARPFTYRVRVPSTATEGQVFVVSGLFWDDPAAKKQIGSTTLTVVRAPVASSVRASRRGLGH